MAKLELFEHPRTRPKMLTAYRDNMVAFVKLYHPEWTDTQIQSAVDELIRAHCQKLIDNYNQALREGKDLSKVENPKDYWPTLQVVKATQSNNFKDRHISYGNRKIFDAVPMIDFCDMYRDKIVSPYGSVYETTDKHTSFLTDKIKADGANRDANKGKMLQCRKNGDIDGARFFNSAQQSIKVVMNSMSGEFGCEGTFLSSPANYNSCTSIARFFVMNAYGHAERFLESNFYFRTFEQVANFVVNCVRLCPDDETILNTSATIGLYIPTAQDVSEFIIKNYKRYSLDRDFSKVEKLVSTLRPAQRTYVYYMSNLRHLFRANDKFFREWAHDVLTDEHVDYTQQVDDVNEIKTFDKELIILLSTVYNHLLPRNKKGNNIAIKECLTPQPAQGVPEAHPEIVEKFVILGRHISQKLAQIQPVFDLFMSCDVSIAYVSEHKNMYRHTVASSDTDSILFTTRSWLRWYKHNTRIDSDAMAINALVVYFLSKATTNLQYQVSANFGACGPDLLTMTMKNEYMMPIELLTSLKKQYASILKFQEGVIYNEAKLDIKGVMLRGSTYSRSSLNYSGWFIRNLIQVICDKGEVSAADLVVQILRFERLVYDDVSSGKLTYISLDSLRSADEYAEPEKSIYFNYGLWEDIFADKYGSILLPTKTYVVPLVGFRADRYSEFLKKNYPDIHVKYQQTVSRVNPRKKISCMPLNTNSDHIPEELLPVTDVRKLVYDQCKALYLVAKSLGFNVGNLQDRIVLFSDVYGWVSPEEAAIAKEHC